LRAAGDGLRLRTAAAVAACGRDAGSNPSAAGAGQTPDNPGAMFADVQSRLVEAAQQLAEYADALKSHDDLMMRDYQTLHPEQ